ncbi:putative sugar phosphate/phosphate translocator [Senna tora]|uniref:Putative sugar phosphate/phosphate translocator n=1 Tax=Senna tora TaxID=362788 RepID=A0A834W2C6_9FABA|nr:putative sugar phosphate/phosphate translocator [Senna tora]
MEPTFMNEASLPQMSIICPEPQISRHGQQWNQHIPRTQINETRARHC